MKNATEMAISKLVIPLGMNVSRFVHGADPGIETVLSVKKVIIYPCIKSTSS